MRDIGTISMGIRAPMLKEGDNIVDITVDTVLNTLYNNNIKLNKNDIIAVTESAVARCQGNYATTDDIRDYINKYFTDKTDTAVLVNPIMSRNRFSVILKGIAKAFKKVVVVFSYPNDEMGNPIVSEELLNSQNIGLDWTLEDDVFHTIFNHYYHPFTGIDYLDLYREIIESVESEAEIYVSNTLTDILKKEDTIICCDIHTTENTYNRCKNEGYTRIYTLYDILKNQINDSGWSEYGVLGSNKSTDDKIKLFPRQCDSIVYAIQQKFKKKTGIAPNVMIYGDGAFKDPVAKIWEEADPVVSPAYTEGLCGTPNELKLKYFIDDKFSNLDGEELKNSVVNSIKTKDKNLVGTMATQGTTPRRITDLVGSLCDLTSGSGDKGTPFVYIKGYFDNYTDDWE